MPRQRTSELREYHESPPTLVRDMEQWLDVGDRREAAERVRQWVIESYELAPLAKATAPRRKSKSRKSR
ncbi:hypothetical protein [Sandaracinus amylolyticus]|uniref:hypothetical protein n=1 Tax=Sandaracinus amylolyticus TaxID=927083 RepID=UPI001F3EF4D5|nr:hypothetical protein [Sandaracinus amylolyticus]UJR83077.1 Hypothetical protein I5071_51430 [Sandaracinus amylolyticus]